MGIVIQCILYLEKNFICRTYIGSVKPFEDPFTNQLEIFNEICILGASYHLLTLTDYVDTSNADLQYNVGWSLIAITVFNMLVNIAIMMTGSIKNLRLNIKKYRFKIKMWLKQRRQKKLAQESKVEKFNQSDIDGGETDYSPISKRRIKNVDATSYGQSRLDDTDFSNIRNFNQDSPQANQQKKMQKTIKKQKLTQDTLFRQTQLKIESNKKKKSITQRAKKEAQKQAQKLIDILGISSKLDQKTNQTLGEGDVSNQFFNAFYKREVNLQKMIYDSSIQNNFDDTQKNLIQRHNSILKRQDGDTNIAQFTYSPTNGRFLSSNTNNFSPTDGQPITFRQYDMEPQDDEKEDDAAILNGARKFSIKPAQTKNSQPVLINNNNFFDNLDVRDSLEVHVGQQMEQLPSIMDQLPQKNKNRTNKGFKKAKKKVKKTTI